MREIEIYVNCLEGDSWNAEVLKAGPKSVKKIMTASYRAPGDFSLRAYLGAGMDPRDIDRAAIALMGAAASVCCGYGDIIFMHYIHAQIPDARVTVKGP